MAHRYFLTQTSGNTALVTGEEAAHLCRVMRIKAGDSVILCDKDGFDYECRVLSASEKELVGEIISRTKNLAEPSVALTVYMALPKSDKLEFIVQKMCELGAVRVVPFVSEFCIAQKSKKEDNKRGRLQKISDEACKQSGRSCGAQVEETLSFKELLQELSTNDKNLFFYENSSDKLKDIPFENVKRVGIIIGSEGGFSPKEAELLTEKGALSVGLGKRILRCETAAVTAAALVMYSLGELE
ncbi:MAG: RsmE family RNA methyltransferase [Oscillospiraceae bacterium]